MQSIYISMQLISLSLVLFLFAFFLHLLGAQSPLVCCFVVPKSGFWGFEHARGKYCVYRGTHSQPLACFPTCSGSSGGTSSRSTSALADLPSVRSLLPVPFFSIFLPVVKHQSTRVVNMLVAKPVLWNLSSFSPVAHTVLLSLSLLAS